MPRVDLTVLAIPAFIGAMGAEYAWQRRHPAAPGESRAGDARRRLPAQSSSSVSPAPTSQTSFARAVPA